MEQAGKGSTVKTTSFDSVQPLTSVTVRRSVALADETRAVVIKEAGASIVAEPETRLQRVDATGSTPAVA